MLPGTAASLEHMRWDPCRRGVGMASGRRRRQAGLARLRGLGPRFPRCSKGRQRRERSQIHLGGRFERELRDGDDVRDDDGQAVAASSPSRMAQGLPRRQRRGLHVRTSERVQ